MKTPYEQFKAAGLSERDITMLRNFGATDAAILLWAKKHRLTETK